MVTYWDTRRFFRVSHGIFWVVLIAFWRETSGNTNHLMSVTPTPFGASQSGTSFVCLLSDPDTDQLNSVVSYRYIQRGNVPPYNIYTLPSGVTPNVNQDLSKVTFDLPTSIEAQGTFSCGLSSTSVPVTILANSRHIQPANGQFTVTASLGERVVLETEIQQTPAGKSVNTDTRWERQSQNDFGIVQEGGTTYEIASVLPQDADVYATYWSDQREDFLFSLVRLIVRGCPTNIWNAPYCNQVCDNCYNGGICDDKTGKCICRPGYSGPNCLTACSIGRFGWDCEHQCGVTVSGSSSCIGTVLCMPDPVGCSCIAGLAGSGCTQSCPSGTFGAGCTEQCHCLNGGSCNQFTGVCISGSCADGWSGTNCQTGQKCPYLWNVPEQCSIGYYGDVCLGKCNCRCDQTTGSCAGTDECVQGFYGPQCQLPCYCLNGAACNKETGECDPDPTTGLSLCVPGFSSSAGAAFGSCGQFEGCFDSCSKTCHCSGGTNDCDGITGACSQGCKTGWFGDACQTRIVEVTFEKVNDGQFMPVSAIVSVDPSDTLTTTELWLQYNDVAAGSQTRYPDLLESREGFYFATFNVNPPDGNTVLFILRYGQGGVTTSSFVAEYYALPVMNRLPIATIVSSMSVTLQWEAWGTQAGDAGDGPVTLYNIYQIQPQPTKLIATVADNQQQAVITTVIGDLMSGTAYSVYVSAVREGVGGEGAPSPFLMFTTLPLTTTTQPVPTTNAATTQPTTTPDATTTKSPSTTKVTTSKRVTTMGVVDTDPPVVDMTTPTGGISPSADGMTSRSQGTSSSSTTTLAAGGGGGNSSAINQLIPIIAVIAVAVVLILIFVIAVAWFLRKRRNRFKRYPPSIVASEADLDRLSGVFPEPSSPSMVDTRSIASTLDGIDNPALEMDEVADSPSAGRHHTLPLIVVAGTDTPPSVRARPISAGLGTQSIKTRLRIPAVNVKDFANYMKAKRQTTDLRVEWESLPKDLARPTTIAKKLENKGKNRYRNVVAYDHSRVVLDPLDVDPNSDYVNACYIKGIKNPKAYIASQGPNEKTLGDMWRMIWQENISIMVMACNLFEEGRPKCGKYWPDKGAPMEFHGINVELESEKQKEEYYIIRKFKITREGEEETRKLTQYHYTTWPDKDVPRHCTPVLKFVNDINQHHDRKAPLLLHCSAGAGRTGALIAIHGMMELAEEKGQVDIYNFVFSMRNSRPNIVQTASQYAFVHDAMLEYLFCKNTFTEAGIFADRLKAIQDQNPETGNAYIEDEYEILNLVSPNLVPEKTRGSMKQDNMAKIRSNHSMPVDSSRPYLMTPRGDDDPSPYINASYMDGYKKKDLFITTQMPMTNTVLDLWRMMYDYNCTSIVQLNAMDAEDKNCPQFWPDAGTNEYGPFTVSLMSKETHPDFEMRHLQLVYTKRDVKSPIPVKHFQYTTWPKDDERPATSEGILQLISAVEKWQKTVEQPGPIVVLCMNACGRSGTFCTIQTSLDQIREEQGVDVLQNVKNLRIHRTNMVDTSAKYLFCYETILDYLKAFDDYTNKKTYQNVPEAQLKKDEGKVPDVLYDEVPSDLKKNATDTKESKDGKDETDSKVASNNEKKSDNNAPVKNGEGEKNNETKSAATGETEAKPSNEDKFKLPPRPKPKPTMKDRKSKGAEGGGTPKGSVKERKGGSKKENKKGSKRGSKKQDQLYENIMFDTKL